MKNYKKGKHLEAGINFLYESLQNKGYSNIEIQKNIFIVGKSKVKHEIDVVIIYELFNTKRYVLIECKNYSKRTVQKEDISALYSKVNDIPFSSGVIYSISGFSDGAKDFAKYYGIEAVEVSETQIIVNSIINNIEAVLPSKYLIPQPFYTVMIKNDKNINTGTYKIVKNNEKDSFILFCSEKSAQNWIVSEDEDVYPVTKRHLAYLCDIADKFKKGICIFFVNSTEAISLSGNDIKELYLYKKYIEKRPST